MSIYLCFTHVHGFTLNILACPRLLYFLTKGEWSVPSDAIFAMLPIQRERCSNLIPWMFEIGI